MAMVVVQKPFLFSACSYWRQDTFHTALGDHLRQSPRPGKNTSGLLLNIFLLKHSFFSLCIESLWETVFQKTGWKTKLSLCEALRFVAFHSVALERIFSNSLNATFCIIFNWREIYVKIIFSKKLGMQLNIFKQEFCARPWGPLIY